MKYEIELGAFVSVYRRRKMTVHAENEVAAIRKAEDRFYYIQQEKAGNMCGVVNVNSINEIRVNGCKTVDEYIENLKDIKKPNSEIIENDIFKIMLSADNDKTQFTDLYIKHD